MVIATLVSQHTMFLHRDSPPCNPVWQRLTTLPMARSIRQSRNSLLRWIKKPHFLLQVQHARLLTGKIVYSITCFLWLNFFGCETCRCFKFDTVEEIVDALQKEDSEWAKETLKLMGNVSPTSLKVTLQQLRTGANLTLGECFKMEYRLVQKFLVRHRSLRAIAHEKACC